MPLFGPPDVEKMKARRDVKSLIKVLSNSKDVQIRKQAVLALGELGDARALKPLVAAQKDQDWDMRSSAPEALVKICSRSIMPFIAALKDGDCDVRYIAAYCLGSTADPRAVEPLCRVLRDPDPLVRGNAV